MTTKTDYRSIMELKQTLSLENRGFISSTEAAQIRTALEIEKRTTIELQNVRDMAIMLYETWIDAAEDNNNLSEVMRLLDCMSAVCYVIDEAKTQRSRSQ